MLPSPPTLGEISRASMRAEQGRLFAFPNRPKRRVLGNRPHFAILGNLRRTYNLAGRFIPWGVVYVANCESQPVLLFSSSFCGEGSSLSLAASEAVGMLIARADSKRPGRPPPPGGGSVGSAVVIAMAPAS